MRGLILGNFNLKYLIKHYCSNILNVYYKGIVRHMYGKHFLEYELVLQPVLDASNRIHTRDVEVTKLFVLFTRTQTRMKQVIR